MTTPADRPIEGCTCLWQLTATSAVLLLSNEHCPAWPHTRHLDLPLEGAR